MNTKSISQTVPTDSKRLLSITEATVYLGVGRNSALKYLESIGAKQQIGRRVLYDKAIIDQHLNNSAKGGTTQ